MMHPSTLPRGSGGAGFPLASSKAPSPTLHRVAPRSAPFARRATPVPATASGAEDVPATRCVFDDGEREGEMRARARAGDDASTERGRSFFSSNPALFFPSPFAPP